MRFLPQGLTKYLPAYLRAHRPLALGLGVAGVVLVVLAFAARGTPPIERVQKPEKLVPMAVDPAQTLQNTVGHLKSQLETQKDTMDTVAKTLVTMDARATEQDKARKADQEQFRGQLQALQKEHEREMAQLRKQREQAPAGKPVGGATPPRAAAPPTPPPPAFQLRTIGSSKDAQRPTLPPFVHHTATAFLPTGCFAKIRLVTGTAATSDIGPNGFGHPMLFSVIEPFECARRLDEIGRVALRQRTGVPLDGCLGFAHGKGNLATSRVEGQATVLSCVMPDSESYEVTIKGYLVDEDGDQGLFGVLERHDSAKVGAAFLAGLINEATAIFSSARKGVTINAVGQASGYGGLENTVNQVANYWLQQARALAPTVRVRSGTTGYLVIQQGVPLEGLHLVNFLKTGVL